MSNYVPTRYITLLGVTPYDPCRYRLGESIDDHISSVVEYATHATMEAYGGHGEVYLLCTKDAEDRTLKHFQSPLHPICFDVTRSFAWGDRFRCISIPIDEGYDNAQLDAVFKTIYALLDERALVEQEFSASGRERFVTISSKQVAPRRIVFDVTNAFRSLQLVAVAAVQARRADWQRRGLAEPPELVMSFAMYDPYGSEKDFPRDPDGNTFEKRQSFKHPVSEVTTYPVRVGRLLRLNSLLDSAEWVEGLNALLRFGRGDDLKNLSKRRADDLTDTPALSDWLKKFADEIGTLADGLCTTQVPQVITKYAIDALESINQIQGLSLEHVHPLFPGLIENLRTELERIACERNQFMSPVGFEKACNLLQWYIRLNRFAEAITAGMEIKNMWGCMTVTPRTNLLPGQHGFNAAWEEGKSRADKEINRLDRATKDSNNCASALGEKGRNPRNATAHAGFRECEIDPAEIRRLTGEIANELSLKRISISNVPLEKEGNVPLPVEEPRLVVCHGFEIAPRVLKQHVTAELKPIRLLHKVSSTLEMRNHGTKTLRIFDGQKLVAAYFPADAFLLNVSLLARLQALGVPVYVPRHKLEALPVNEEVDHTCWTELPTLSLLVG